MENKVLAMVMAGGKGERLYPLTLERSKPSVPFGGKYRIIDFVLSNFVNSEIYSIYVLVQYKSQSLIEHIRKNWRREGVLEDHFITVVPPQMRRDDVADWYRGTADSIYQNINLILDFSPDLVSVFGADHIYRMDVREMIEFHRQKDADLTISALPLKQNLIGSFGAALVNKDLRVKSFIEKPKALNFSSNKNSFFLSMGNYIFKPSVLLKVLEEDSRVLSSSHDFGKDIIPRMIRDCRVFIYDFSKNTIPGLKSYEEEAYWRDVGTIKSFFKANRDLLGKRPRLDLSNKFWPIYGASAEDLPPSKIEGSQIVNSLISEGCQVENSYVKNSIIGRGVIIKESQVIDSIIMDFTEIERSCKIRKAIIDRFNIIKRKTAIGFDITEDRKDYFVKEGIVVVKRGPRQRELFK
ncbi:MAG TPA: glucose-1-phosphate adenylyltransferase [Candidatus Omnitrophica bacterium]|nr:MAG: glucose-1-phosphate adenylyltransferase [Candidatus Omnitrophota bacterium]RKY35061.1 MAG: glucose-1-phosphate adenylyltransferase [Candidatus Omnitrophota bacterium]RKY44420.1 MAG: glucose-1-phosphate adenylyltransferase [Candidatus Omnitrophota bacterium]HEC69522.1 glucose-1-phosphate adenylyltransferase [Candidatus Omnitrophota bacterium]